MAPAILDGDPANLFNFFPTYQRGAMTVQGYREIVGDERFFDFAKGLISGSPTATSARQVHRARRRGQRLEGSKARAARPVFQQWLYGEAKPTILPADFA